MIGAVVMAAGQSRRMGRPKMLLPWGNTTVIGRVVGVLAEAGIREIVVVAGGLPAEITRELAGQPVRVVVNARYASSEMLQTCQIGLSSLSEDMDAALLALGDQPQIQLSTVEALLAAYKKGEADLVVPSYHQRRGHPWLVHRRFWPEITALPASATLRDFLNNHTAEINYVGVDSAHVLTDLDTPEDYANHEG